MAFYVSAIQGPRKVLAAGPYRRHGDALAMVDTVRRWAEANTRGADHFDVAWGTCRNRAGHPAGRLTIPMGLELDSSGFVTNTNTNRKG